MPRGIKKVEVVLDLPAILRDAHTALQLRPSTLTAFHHLAMQHMVSTTTTLVPGHTDSDSRSLSNATAAFIALYGGNVWPSYSAFRHHLMAPDSKSSRDALSYPRDALPSGESGRRIRGLNLNEEEMVAKTKLGKAVREFLRIVVLEVKKEDHSVVDLGEEVRERSVKAVCGQEEWAPLEKDIERLIEQEMIGGIGRDVDMSGDGVAVDDRFTSGEIPDGEVLGSQGGRIATGEEWLKWAKEEKKVRERADSVTKVREWIECLEKETPEAGLEEGEQMLLDLEC